MIVETITIVGIAAVLAALILMPDSDTYAAESDAGNRIGLRIDHVELTREFLSKLEIKTPTLTRPGIVNIALRPSADDARVLSVAVPSGHTTAFVLEANARRLRLLIVRPHIY